MGLAKLEKASLTDATPSTTHRVGPMSEVTGMGTGSVTHQMATSAMMASRWWAEADMALMGMNQMAMAMMGPSSAPMARRFLSKEFLSLIVFTSRM